MFIIQFIRGFCMALADSVPGVSGGTIAFLLGFYDKFIDSIDDLLVGTKEKRKDAFFFLIKLGIGWVSGFVIAVLVLTSVFEGDGADICNGKAWRHIRRNKNHA